MHIPNETSSQKSRSYAWIRQYIDEVVFSKHLAIPDKIVAIAILHYLNRKSGATCVDPLTVAKRLGLEFDVVRKSIGCLVRYRHLKVAGRYLVPLLRNDSVNEYYSATIASDPQSAGDDDGWADFIFDGVRSRRGGKDYYACRGALIELIIFNGDLTPGERLVAIGIALRSDPETMQCDDGQAKLAASLAVSRKAVNYAIPVLKSQGYLADVVSVPSKKQTLTLHARPQMALPPMVAPMVSPGVSPGVSPSNATFARAAGVSRSNLVDLNNLRRTVAEVSITADSIDITGMTGHTGRLPGVARTPISLPEPKAA